MEHGRKRRAKLGQGLSEKSRTQSQHLHARSSRESSNERSELEEVPAASRKKRLRKNSETESTGRVELDDYGRYYVRRASRGSIVESVSSEDVLSSTSSSDARGNVEQFEKLLCKEFNRDVIRSPVIKIPYKVLKKITGKFGLGAPGPYYGPRKLGSGGTGTVFLGTFSDGKLVAVKRLDKNKVSEDLAIRQFVMEVEDVAKYRHPHILDILGYSVDGPHPCIVYGYLSEGSVLDHLLQRRGKSFLDWQDRLRIAYETADAINFLHTSGPLPLVHRDIKAANIMLDENLVAKLGDYGFAIFGAAGGVKTTTVVGTQAYMAPEAFYGDVSTKLDTYGFGVVLFELLTGMPGYDDKRAHPGVDLLGYVKQNSGADPIQFLNLCEPEAEWDPATASRLARVGFYCVRPKAERPTMSVVKSALDALLTLAFTTD